MYRKRNHRKSPLGFLPPGNGGTEGGAKTIDNLEGAPKELHHFNEILS